MCGGRLFLFLAKAEGHVWSLWRPRVAAVTEDASFGFLQKVIEVGALAVTEHTLVVAQCVAIVTFVIIFKPASLAVTEHTSLDVVEVTSLAVPEHGTLLLQKLIITITLTIPAKPNIIQI